MGCGDVVGVIRSARYCAGRDGASAPSLPFLQRTGQIVDAGAGGLLFAVGERMNHEATQAKSLNDIRNPLIDEDGAANSFRACIGCLVSHLLTGRESRGVLMTARNQPN